MNYQIKNKKVPKLRFEEFNEEWGCKKSENKLEEELTKIVF